jgi:signal transduction histidine kinase
LFASILGGFLWSRRASAGRCREAVDFLATVSHELRTPLNAIVGWVNLLKSGTLTSAETARALDGIERNLHLETRLVDELLDASRLLGGRTTIALAPVDLRAAMQAAVARVTPAARAKGVKLVVGASPVKATVFGNEQRLTDAVWQLLANGVKFTPPGGEVRIDLEVRGEHARVRVADSGEGIALDDLAHVLEPFRQGHIQTKRVGLGLGLAVVRQLVELHGGTIAAHSAGRGHGAVFSVTLPLNSQSDWQETTAQSDCRGRRASMLKSISLQLLRHDT